MAIILDGSDAVGDLGDALAAKANLASPTFTGTPALPDTTTVGGVASFGAWTSYTPVVSGGWSLGNGTMAAAYCRIGKLVQVRIYIKWGSTSSYGTGSGLVLTEPPFTFRSEYNWASLGAVVCRDASAGESFRGWTVYGPGFGFIPQKLDPSTAGRTSGVGQNTPFIWAVNDEFYLTATYETT